MQTVICQSWIFCVGQNNTIYYLQFDNINMKWKYIWISKRIRKIYITSHLFNTLTFISNIILQIKFVLFSQYQDQKCFCIMIEHIDFLPPINNKTFALTWHQLVNQSEVCSHRQTGGSEKGENYCLMAMTFITRSRLVIIFFVLTFFYFEL